MERCGVADLKFSDCEPFRRFRSHYFLKSQCTPSASSGDISPREKKTSRGDQTDTRAENYDVYSLIFKDSVMKKSRLHPMRVKRTFRLKKKKMNLKDYQRELRVGELETSQHSGSGKELQPIDNVPKRISGDGDVEFSDKLSLPHFKNICLRKDQFTLHASTRDLPPKERNDIWHIEMDTIAGDLVVSEESRSEKEGK
jgi:hypothetical protein